jgi:hypothetical protein
LWSILYSFQQTTEELCPMLRRAMLTSWSRVILGKIIFTQLAKKNPALFEEQRFLIANTTAGHSIQS